MTVTPDDIASLVLSQFDKLPAKRKPQVRANGVREWVPLSGIVAQETTNYGVYPWHADGQTRRTGMKCLPTSKIAGARGNVLHDWHAEVLAVRAFNRFVLDECRAMLLDGGRGSAFLRRRTRDEREASERGGSGEDGDDGGSWNGQPFAWRDDVLLHMYCSDAPCGDASMELVMAAQPDATPWAVPLPSPSRSPAGLLAGRAYFSELGLVRRKPARADAPATLSKSCSDKLALRQAVSLLAAPTSLLLDPRAAYLRSLVLPASRCCPAACRRAFSADDGGRMRGLPPPAPRRGGYAFRPFAVSTTAREFAYSRAALSSPPLPSPPLSPSLAPSPLPTAATATATPAGSNLSTAWTLSGREETTLGGVLQGRRPPSPSSPSESRAASFASRRQLWSLAASVAALLPLDDGDDDGAADVRIRRALAAATYGELKASALLGPRRRAKREARHAALRGWVRNEGDEAFGL
ncbi:adenosine deaminase/editase [Durotheca rogersii]|uniref:adenosine deaminase/editase n=1 Tax=Durotheca rogersii TaxID=419775 RepID=UPI0022210EDB|nr:adenosine deaminase/editase [Durotheca rogersii]KAI5867423.1 adenosine deaminase/editase [Durotheca rogersii]